ncbi:hypothetical protein FA13DRAFT_1266595 [Coprinellus micaceus]|uniref:Uncharacterized protein n=1 Tax=Coprinellus micaceus TaxID=71717 RepID=A0A4Y7R912_COPMI|nr:hypothetical protein FA13DRAFT_1266595 [Coprinellus micaceus]
MESLQCGTNNLLRSWLPPPIYPLPSSQKSTSKGRPSCWRMDVLHPITLLHGLVAAALEVIFSNLPLSLKQRSGFSETGSRSTRRRQTETMSFRAWHRGGQGVTIDYDVYIPSWQLKDGESPCTGGITF